MANFITSTSTKTYKYELLDKDENKIGEIPAVKDSGRVGFQQFSEIKRTCTVKAKYTGIEYVGKRMRPIMIADGKEYSLGVFLIATAPRQDNMEKTIEIQGYDKTILLTMNTLDKFLYIAPEVNIVAKINEILSLLGFTKIKSTASEHTLSLQKMWEAGVNYKTVINDLLSIINYYPIWFDSDGFARIEPYKPPDQRTVEVEYKTDELSTVFAGGVHELNLFNVPNKFNVVSTSDQTKTPLFATYENRDPQSPTSIDRVGYIRTKDYKVEGINTQVELDIYAQRMAFQYDEQYEKITFSTSNNPDHGFATCIYLRYDPLQVYGRFLETAWEMNLSLGGKMNHECRRLTKI